MTGDSIIGDERPPAQNALEPGREPPPPPNARPSVLDEYQPRFMPSYNNVKASQSPSQSSPTGHLAKKHKPNPTLDRNVTSAGCSVDVHALDRHSQDVFVDHDSTVPSRSTTVLDSNTSAQAHNSAIGEVFSVDDLETQAQMLSQRTSPSIDTMIPPMPFPTQSHEQVQEAEATSPCQAYSERGRTDKGIQFGPTKRHAPVPK